MVQSASDAPLDEPTPGPVLDVHHHWLPAELVDRMEDHVGEGYRVVRTEQGIVNVLGPDGLEELTVDPRRWCDPKVQLAEMDAAGIDVALLSAACYPAWLTLRAARLLNDAAADLQRTYPDRFVAMAHVPPFGAPGALDELHRAGHDLGLRGVCITTNFRQHYPDDPEYRPFLCKAAELDMPVFVHAAGAPVDHGALTRYGLYRTLGRAHDQCLVTVRLLHSGILEELPNLRFVVGHLGGAFFAQVHRFVERDKLPTEPFPEVPFASLLDRFLFDTAPSFVWTSREIRWAVEGVGASHLALGSDYPVGTGGAGLIDAVRHVRELDRPAAERARIAGGNALAFYGLAAAGGARARGVS